MHKQFYFSYFFLVLTVCFIYKAHQKAKNKKKITAIMAVIKIVKNQDRILDQAK